MTRDMPLSGPMRGWIAISHCSIGLIQPQRAGGFDYLAFITIALKKFKKKLKKKFKPLHYYKKLD